MVEISRLAVSNEGPKAVVDVLTGLLYQKATSGFYNPRQDIHEQYLICPVKSQQSTSFHGSGIFSHKRDRFPKEFRSRRAGTERQMKLDLLGKLTTIFETSSWENFKFEHVVNYRFCFTIRLFLLEQDVDFRIAALRLLRHASLSDRILQMYSDLFIPEFVSLCIERIYPIGSESFFGRLSVADKWNIEERVSALKLIKLWCTRYLNRISIVPIPVCFLRSLVSIASILNKEDGSGSLTIFNPIPTCDHFDPLRFFCLETLRDLAVSLEFPDFRRFIEIGGVSVIMDTVTDVMAFEVEPEFCCSLIIALSGLLGDHTRRLAIAENDIIELKRSSNRLFCLCCIFQASTSTGEASKLCTVDASKAWWFSELSSLCSCLLEVLTLFPNLYKKNRGGIFSERCMFDKIKREETRKQQKECYRLQRAYRCRQWKAASSAFFTLCRTFSGLLALAAHPYGLRSLVELLWQPIDTFSRLNLVTFFMRLLLMALCSEGRPIQNQEDLFGLIFTRCIRGYITKSFTELQQFNNLTQSADSPCSHIMNKKSEQTTTSYINSYKNRWTNKSTTDSIINKERELFSSTQGRCDSDIFLSAINLPSAEPSGSSDILRNSITEHESQTCELFTFINGLNSSQERLETMERSPFGNTAQLYHIQSVKKSVGNESGISSRKDVSNFSTDIKRKNKEIYNETIVTSQYNGLSSLQQFSRPFIGATQWPKDFPTISRPDGSFEVLPLKTQSFSGPSDVLEENSNEFCLFGNNRQQCSGFTTLEAKLVDEKLGTVSIHTPDTFFQPVYLNTSHKHLNLNALQKLDPTFPGRDHVGKCVGNTSSLPVPMFAPTVIDKTLIKSSCVADLNEPLIVSSDTNSSMSQIITRNICNESSSTSIQMFKDVSMDSKESLLFPYNPQDEYFKKTDNISNDPVLFSRKDKTQTRPQEKMFVAYDHIGSENWDLSNQETNSINHVQEPSQIISNLHRTSSCKKGVILGNGQTAVELVDQNQTIRQTLVPSDFNLQLKTKNLIQFPGDQQIPGVSVDVLHPINGGKDPNISQYNETNTQQYKDKSSIEVDSVSSVISSLSTLCFSQPLGTPPSELTLASGFGYGATVDLRDIYGMLLLRIFLHAGLHLALASLVVELKGTIISPEEILKSANCSFEEESDYFDENKEQSGTVALLLMRAAQLLSLLLCASSFILPAPMTESFSPYLHTETHHLFDHCQNNELTKQIKIKNKHGYSTRSNHLSELPISKQNTNTLLNMSNQQHVLLGTVSSVSDSESCYYRDLLYLNNQESVEHITDSYAPSSVLQTESSLVTLAPIQIKLQHDVPCKKTKSYRSVKKRHFWDNEKLYSKTLDNSDNFEPIKLQNDISIKPIQTTIPVSWPLTRLGFPSSDLGSDIVSDHGTHDLTFKIKQGIAPLSQARKLLHHFSRFISLTFLTHDKRFNLEGYQKEFFQLIGISHESLLTAKQQHIPSTCATNGLHYSKLFKNDLSMSDGLEINSDIYIKDDMSLYKTNHLLDNPPFHKTNCITSCCCMCCGIHRMKCVLSYIKFSVGSLVHNTLYFSLRVLRMTQLPIPFNSLNGDSSDSIFSSYILATKILINDYQMNSPELNLMNHHFNVNESLPTASKIGISHWSEWNWAVIHRIIGSLAHAHMYEFIKTPLTKSFLNTLLHFFLPSHLLFSALPWDSSMLHIVTCGVNLLLFLFVIDESIIFPKLESSHDILPQSQWNHIVSPASANPPNVCLNHEHTYATQDKDHVNEWVMHVGISQLRQEFLDDIIYHLKLELDIIISETKKNNFLHIIKEEQTSPPLWVIGCDTANLSWEKHSEKFPNIFSVESLMHDQESFKNAFSSFSQKQGSQFNNTFLTKLDNYNNTKTCMMNHHRIDSSMHHKDFLFKKEHCIQKRSDADTIRIINNEFITHPQPVQHQNNIIVSRHAENSDVSNTPSDMDTHITKIQSVSSYPSADPHSTSDLHENDSYGILTGHFLPSSTIRSKNKIFESNHGPIPKHVGSARVFHKIGIETSLSREYGTLIGCISTTMNGVSALIECGFFTVLSQFIQLRLRDDLVILFLKQLNMNYTPCRSMIEQVALYGTTYLRLAILNHFGLIIEGGGFTTPFSNKPSYEIICQPGKTHDHDSSFYKTKRVMTEIDLLEKNKEVSTTNHMTHRTNLHFHSTGKEDHIHTYHTTHPHQHFIPKLKINSTHYPLKSSMIQSERYIEEMDINEFTTQHQTIKNLHDDFSYCSTCGLSNVSTRSLENDDKYQLFDLPLIDPNYTHPHDSNLYKTKSYSPSYLSSDDHRFINNCSFHSTPGQLSEQTTQQDDVIQVTYDCKHSTHHLSNRHTKKKNAMSKKTIRQNFCDPSHNHVYSTSHTHHSSINPLQPLWEWTLYCMLYLLFAVDSSVHSSIDTNFDPLCDPTQTFILSHQPNEDVHDVSSSNQPLSPIDISTHDNRYRSSVIVAEVALHLITQLCRLGGQYIVFHLVPFLPDEQGRIILPSFKTVSLNHSIKQRQVEQYDIKQYSFLKDWPSALKIQLLHLDIGVKYLIKTNWLPSQLDDYDCYAHNSYIKELKYSQFQTTDDIYCKNYLTGSSNHDHMDLDELNTITDNNGILINPIINSLNISCPPKKKKNAYHQYRRGSQHMYVSLIDTLLQRTIWNFEQDIMKQEIITQSYQLSHAQQHILCEVIKHNLLIPDPYRYHFYCKYGLQSDKIIPPVISSTSTYTHPMSTYSTEACIHRTTIESSDLYDETKQTESSNLFSSSVLSEEDIEEQEYDDGGVWAVRKNQLQSQHQRSPLEFLSHLPLSFIIKISYATANNHCHIKDNEELNETVMYTGLIFRYVEVGLIQKFYQTYKSTFHTIHPHHVSNQSTCQDSLDQCSLLPPLFLLPSVATAASLCSNPIHMNYLEQKNNSYSCVDARLKPHGFNLADLNSHATSFGVFALADISISLIELRKLPPGKELLLQAAMKIGSSYVSHSGTLTQDTTQASWSSLPIQISMIDTFWEQHHLHAQKFAWKTDHRINSIPTSKEELIHISRTVSDEHIKLNSRCNQQPDVLFSHCDVSSTILDTHSEHIDKLTNPMISDHITKLSNIATNETSVLQFQLNSPNIRWTWCLETESSFASTQACYTRPLYPHPTKPTGTIRLIRVEGSLDLTSKFNHKSILEKILPDHMIKKHLSTILHTPKLVETTPMTTSAAAKPPPNLLTYVALSQTGLNYIESSGFLSRLKSNIQSFDDRRSIDIRSYIWSLGHLASSEIGVIFLAKHRLLHRLVELAYSTSRTALKGTCLYALGLIPMTPRTTQLLKSLNWDLSARGPLHCGLSRFLEIESDVHLQNNMPDIIVQQSKKGHTVVNSRISHNSILKSDSSIDLSAKTIHLNKELTMLPEKLSQKNDNDIVWRYMTLDYAFSCGTILPSGITPGYDLINIIFSKPMNQQKIATFGVDIMLWKRIRKNTIHHQQQLHFKNQLQDSDNLFKQTELSTDVVFSSLYTQFKDFYSFLLDSLPVENDTNHHPHHHYPDKFLLIESGVLPVGFISFLKMKPKITNDKTQHLTRNFDINCVNKKLPSNDLSFDTINHTPVNQNKQIGKTNETKLYRPSIFIKDHPIHDSETHLKLDKHMNKQLTSFNQLIMPSTSPSFHFQTNRDTPFYDSSYLSIQNLEEENNLYTDPFIQDTAFINELEDMNQQAEYEYHHFINGCRPDSNQSLKSEVVSQLLTQKPLLQSAEHSVVFLKHKPEKEIIVLKGAYQHSGSRRRSSIKLGPTLHLKKKVHFINAQGNKLKKYKNKYRKNEIKRFSHSSTSYTSDSSEKEISFHSSSTISSNILQNKLAWNNPVSTNLSYNPSDNCELELSTMNYSNAIIRQDHTLSDWNQRLQFFNDKTSRSPLPLGFYVEGFDTNCNGTPDQQDPIPFSNTESQINVGHVISTQFYQCMDKQIISDNNYSSYINKKKLKNIVSSSASSSFNHVPNKKLFQQFQNRDLVNSMSQHYSKHTEPVLLSDSDISDGFDIDPSFNGIVLSPIVKGDDSQNQNNPRDSLVNNNQCLTFLNSSKKDPYIRKDITSGDNLWDDCVLEQQTEQEKRTKWNPFDNVSRIKETEQSAWEDIFSEFKIALSQDSNIEDRNESTLLSFECYSDIHMEVLKQIAKLTNSVTAKTENLVATLRKQRNSSPHIFLSVELWWRVQMLLRVYTFRPGYRTFIASLFTETFRCVDAWLYLDLLVQYIKWQCTIASCQSNAMTSNLI